MNCETVFTTEENVLYGQCWAVRDKSSKIRPFSKEKLFLSIYKSCEHRKTAITDSSSLTNTVIKRMISYANTGIIDAPKIKQVTQTALNRFDRSASVHYHAFHNK
jgi:transcriptional regulator NrdR family protein